MDRREGTRSGVGWGGVGWGGCCAHPLAMHTCMTKQDVLTPHALTAILRQLAWRSAGGLGGGGGEGGGCARRHTCAGVRGVDSAAGVGMVTGASGTRASGLRMGQCGLSRCAGPGAGMQAARRRVCWAGERSCVRRARCCSLGCWCRRQAQEGALQRLQGRLAARGGATRKREPGGGGVPPRCGGHQGKRARGVRCTAHCRRAAAARRRTHALARCLDSRHLPTVQTAAAPLAAVTSSSSVPTRPACGRRRTTNVLCAGGGRASHGRHIRACGRHHAQARAGGAAGCRSPHPYRDSPAAAIATAP
jgi:hypothetical protein